MAILPQLERLTIGIIHRWRVLESLGVTARRRTRTACYKPLTCFASRLRQRQLVRYQRRPCDRAAVLNSCRWAIKTDRAQLDRHDRWEHPPRVSASSSVQRPARLHQEVNVLRRQGRRPTQPRRTVNAWHCHQWRVAKLRQAVPPQNQCEIVLVPSPALVCSKVFGILHLNTGRWEMAT